LWPRKLREEDEFLEDRWNFRLRSLRSGTEKLTGLGYEGKKITLKHVPVKVNVVGGREGCEGIRAVSLGNDGPWWR